MKFSKKAFFAAALLIGGLVIASADTINVDGVTRETHSDNYVRDYVIGANGNLTLNVTDTLTLYGRFLGAGMLVGAGNGFDAYTSSTGSVRIEGGGVFNYSGYEDTDLWRSVMRIENGVPEYPDYNALNSMIHLTGRDLDAAASGFSGTLSVASDTTLIVSGYLNQNAVYPIPLNRYTQVGGDGNRPDTVLVRAGLSSLILEGGARISFHKSMTNERGDDGTELQYNAISNLQADARSTVDVGANELSTARLSIMASAPDLAAGRTGEATVGIITGNGRFYFGTDGSRNIMGQSGSISITNRANFILNKDENGVKDISGDHQLADVYFGDGLIRVGTDATGANIVDNVFSEATAIMLSADPYVEAIFTYDSGNVWTSVAGKIGVGAPGGVSNVHIHGTQVFNNLQSLFVERERLVVSQVREGGAREFFDPWNPAGQSYNIDVAIGATVHINENATLVINQLENRDGLYYGTFVSGTIGALGSTANDGIIEKIGAGTFINNPNTAAGLINKLVIREGTWISTPNALGTNEDGRVIVRDKGTFRLIVNYTMRFNIGIEGTNSFIVSRDSVSIVTNEDGSTTLDPGIKNDGRLFWVSSGIYRYISGGIQEEANVDGGRRFNADGSLIITRAQDRFHGTVKIYDGITLELGMGLYDASRVAGGNPYALGSVFSNASKIELTGAIDAVGVARRAGLKINSYQIANNLTGAENTFLQLDNYGMLVWNAQALAGTNFSGTISGTGSIVKLGAAAIAFGENVNYSGSTIALGGSFALSAVDAINPSAGVVLGNTTSLSNSSSGSQSFGALIGSERSTFYAGSNAITIGVADSNRDELIRSLQTLQQNGATEGLARFFLENNGYYLATYEGDTKYLNGGLNLATGAGLTTELVGNFAAPARPLTKNLIENGVLQTGTLTVADTREFLKDPGLLANAFKNLYATVDDTTFEKMKQSPNWVRFNGVNSNSLGEFLVDVFSVARVETFLAGVAWTDRQEADLRAFAEALAANPTMLLSDGCWTKEIYDMLKDVNATRFLNENFGLPNQDGTFFSFISVFDPNYRFRLTDANIELLRTKYGFATGSWFGTEEQLWAAFEKAIGIQSDGATDYGMAFAGTISGAGASINKIGKESLILTGENVYTGATRVSGGELRVDWNAIQKTESIEVAAGAILTIVSDPDAKDKDGRVLKNEFLPEKITGAGTILKDGVGELTILSGLADGKFAGNLIVGKDTLIVNVQGAKAGEKIDFNSSVFINTNAEFVLDVLPIQVAGASNSVGTGVPVEIGSIVLKGSINGEGKFTKRGPGKLTVEKGESLDTGASGGIEVLAGDLELQFNEPLSQGKFRDSADAIKIGASTLTLNVSAAAGTLDYAGVIEGETGSILVKTGTGGLILSGDAATSAAWSLENLNLAAGTLEIAAGANYKFKTVDSQTGTTLAVNGGLVLDVAPIAPGEENPYKIAGRLEGSGTITKEGAGELVFTGTSNVEDFTGTFNLDAGAINLAVAGTETANFTFSLATSASVAEGGTLIKSGTGTAIIALGGNQITADKLKFDVRAGTLQVAGALLATLPKTLNIEENAKFDINPASTARNLSDIESLTGKGVLGIAGGAIGVSANINGDFTGIVQLAGGASLALDAAVDRFSGIGGEAGTTINIGSNSLTIHQDVDSTFTGTFNGTSGATEIQIVGEGRFALSDISGNDASVNNISGISLGDGLLGGNVAVANDINTGGNAAGDITVISRENCSVAITGAGLTETDVYSGTIRVATPAAKIGLLRNGAIDAARISTTFSLAGYPVLQMTVSNYSTGTLIVRNFENIESKVELATDSTGTLAIDTANQISLRKTISGTGNFEKLGIGTLIVAANQTYAGTTTVSAGTLAFGGGITLQSNALLVKTGATLRNGATLAGAQSSVTFENSSRWEIDMSIADTSLAYSGALNVPASSADAVVLKIENLTQATRGKGIAVLKYTGTPESFVAPVTLTENSFKLDSAGQRVLVDYATLLATGTLYVYASQNHLRDLTAVQWHEGLDATLNVLSRFARPDDFGRLNNLSAARDAIGKAINDTPTAQLAGAVNNLSALGYGAMISMPRAGFAADNNAVSARLEQRLYDNGLPSAVWEYETDAEFFAQATGTFVKNSDDADSMVYDFNTYGIVAGTDVKFDTATSAGIALSFDHGKADMHDSGGKIEMDSFRATAFIGHMLNETFTLNGGLQAGYASYDVKRRTIVGENKGDANGWQVGAFSDLYAVIPLHSNGATGTNVSLMPHVGFALAHFSVGSTDETGSASALNVRSFSGTSLQAEIGATLNALFMFGETGARFGFDLSLSHEFLDDEVDIDYSIAKYKTSVTTKAMSQTALTLGPRVSLDFTDKVSAFLAYEFKIGTESETAHAINLGFRKRF